MEQVPVDIVLATNRVGPFLAETLESVRGQTYRHWNLIVVDDGTPDEHAVPRAVDGMPSTLVVRQGNRGPSAARNRGICAGEAPLIAFLDDDDTWAPEKLEAQVAAMSSTPSAVASFTAGRYIDAHGREFDDGWPAPHEPSRRFISGEAPAPRIVTLMVRRSAHEAVGHFNESYRLAEDNDYILRLAILGEMVAVERPLTAYRRHDRNTSVPNSLDGRMAGRRLLRERLAATRGQPELQALLQAHRNRFELTGADECVRALADAVRRGDMRRLMREAGWAFGAPARTSAALTRALLRRRR